MVWSIRNAALRGHGLRPVVLNGADPGPQGTLGDFWRHSWFSRLRERRCSWRAVRRDRGCRPVSCRAGAAEKEPPARQRLGPLSRPRVCPLPAPLVTRAALLFSAVTGGGLRGRVPSSPASVLLHEVTSVSPILAGAIATATGGDARRASRGSLCHAPCQCGSGPLAPPWPSPFLQRRWLGGGGGTAR